MSTRIERRRHEDLDDVVDRLPTGCPEGTAALLLTTTVDSVYPTTAGAFFACSPTEIDGPEIEGGMATYTPDATQVIYAINQGTQVPPQGTRVIGHFVGGRLVFRYDG